MTRKSDAHKCRNCDSAFQGVYCPSCGQSSKEFNRPVIYLLDDFLGSMFSFDTRVWRSFSSLLFRPGTMEADYVAGKRARYVPPFRLYLFLSFFFFLSLSTLTDRAVHENKQVLTSIGVSNSQDSASGELPAESAVFGPDAQDSLLFRADSSEVPLTLEFENGSGEMKARDVLANPDKYVSRFFRYFSWAFFVLMPLYRSLLWLFFRRSYPYYLAHLLLSMNQHLFAFSVFTLVMLPQVFWPAREVGWEGYMVLAIPVYALLGVKRLYSQGWWRSLFRLLVLQSIYLIAASITVVVVVYFAVA